MGWGSCLMACPENYGCWGKRQMIEQDRFPYNGDLPANDTVAPKKHCLCTEEYKSTSKN